MEDEEEQEQECIWTMDARRRLLAPRRIIIIISLSLSYPLSVRKSLPWYSCRAEKQTLRRSGAFPARLEWRKKAEVLNSLSLSTLSETQRERERARANDRRLHTGDARNGREKEAPFSAFL